jgi:hypothetical protein
VGTLAIKVAWPVKATGIKAQFVPAASESIKVWVEGTSLSTIINRPASQGRIDNVREGLQLVRAAAYPQPNAQGVAQAEGSQQVQVVANTTTTCPTLTMGSTIKRVRVLPEVGLVKVGETLQFSVTCEDSDGSSVLVPTGGISWSIAGGDAYATVDPATGLATGVKAKGTATVRGTEKESGVSGTASLTVLSSEALQVSPTQPTTLDSGDALLVSPTSQSLPSLPWAAVRPGEALDWRVSVLRSGYYQLAANWRDASTDWGLRAEVMLGDRVLAVIYDETPSGAVRLAAGQYDLTVRNLFWPQVEVRSLCLTPTGAPFQDPVATFCAVQDWHTDMHRQGGLYNRFLAPGDEQARDREALNAIVGLHPDFLVGNGDLVDYGYAASIDKFAAFMAGLPFPWFATLGHHETVAWAGAREHIKSAWGPAVPGPDTWYSFDRAGIRFVFLDSAYFMSPSTGDWFPFPPPGWLNAVGCPPQERAWLRDLLAYNQSHDHLPVIIFTHHTLVGYRPLPPPLVQAGLHYKTEQPADHEEMLSILRPDPYVRAVFSGHAHFQQVRTVGGIVHVQGAAMAEGAMTFLRVLVLSDHLEVETYQPVSQSYLLKSALPTGTWAIGYPSDINTRIDL